MLCSQEFAAASDVKPGRSRTTRFRASRSHRGRRGEPRERRCRSCASCSCRKEPAPQVAPPDGARFRRQVIPALIPDGAQSPTPQRGVFFCVSPHPSPERSTCVTANRAGGGETPRRRHRKVVRPDRLRLQSVASCKNTPRLTWAGGPRSHVGGYGLLGRKAPQSAASYPPAPIDLNAEAINPAPWCGAVPQPKRASATRTSGRNSSSVREPLYR